MFSIVLNQISHNEKSEESKFYTNLYIMAHVKNWQTPMEGGNETFNISWEIMLF